MNPHFQSYPDLASPHSPSPESNNYTTITGNGIGGGISSNGGGGGGGIGVGTGNNGSGPMTSAGPGPGPGPILNGGIGNNVNGSSNSSNNGMVHHQQNGHGQQMSMDGGQPTFHQLNNNNSPIKHCAGCGGKIVERFFLHALDRFWHNSCLKCYCCGAMLADIGTSCFTRSGMILCKSDYSRMFGSASCSSCGQTIAANEFVMRTTSPVVNNQQQQQQQQLSSSTSSPSSSSSSPPGGHHLHHHHHQQSSPILENHHQHNQKHFIPGQVEHHVFHLKCFACSKCSSQLRPGDRYYMLAGSLVCEQDWHKLLKSSSPSTPIRKGKVGRPRRSKD